jgi:cobalamin biosynthesis protein CobD/CbiB
MEEEEEEVIREHKRTKVTKVRRLLTLIVGRDDMLYILLRWI